MILFDEDGNLVPQIVSKKIKESGDGMNKFYDEYNVLGLTGFTPEESCRLHRETLLEAIINRNRKYFNFKKVFLNADNSIRYNYEKF